MISLAHASASAARIPLGCGRHQSSKSSKPVVVLDAIAVHVAGHEVTTAPIALALVVAVVAFVLSWGVPVGTGGRMERELTPEERAACSDDPSAQSRLILEESEARTAAPEPVERRTSDETVPPVD